MRIIVFILSFFLLFASPAKANNERFPKQVLKISGHAMAYADWHVLDEFLYYFDDDAVIKTLIVHPPGSPKQDYIIEQKVRNSIDEIEKAAKIKWKAGHKVKYSNPKYEKVGKNQVNIIFDAYYTMDNTTSPAIFIVEKDDNDIWRVVEFFSVQHVPEEAFINAITAAEQDRIKKKQQAAEAKKKKENEEEIKMIFERETLQPAE